MAILPDNIISKIADPAERKRQGPTWAEAVNRGNHRLERRLHGDVSGFLKRHEDKIALVHHTNPTKQTRATVGEPDYTIHFMSGATAFLELKVGKNTLSDEQEKILTKLRQSGKPVLVTGIYAEAIKFIATYF